jgi:MFS family permease
MTHPRPAPREGGAGKLVVLMITAFVDMAGLLMVIPLIPFFAKSMGAGGFIVGLLVSSFSIAQLISAPLWGRFSDRYGRRPALLVGLTASALSYIVFAFADSLWLLFVMRLVQGAGGGTVSVIQAYVADATRPQDRAKSLGWLSAATNAGVAIGPLIGSLSLGLGRSAPGLVAAGLCVVNIGFAARYLTESHDVAGAAAKPRVKGRTTEAVTRVLSHSRETSSRLILIYAIGMGGFHGANAVLALYLAARFGVTARTIGFFYAYIGVISVVTRAGVLGWAVDRFGELRLSRFGISLLAAGLMSMAFISPIADPAAAARMLGGILPPAAVALLPFLPLALAVALLPLGTAFTFPCVTSMLSRVIPQHERGLYMGVQQTFGGIARVVFPVVAGLLFDRMTGLPFVVSGAFVAATLLLGKGLERDVGAEV